MLKLLDQVRIRPRLRLETGLPDLEGADRLHQGLLHRPADRHDLAGALHRGPDLRVYGRELVERPPGNLRDDVVEGRLEGGARSLGDGIWNLVEGEADRDLGGDAGDGVAGRLRGQSR